MINFLSYVGMNMQSEVCLWTLLGLMRTIFDATLFKVNANLKQVWQMSMPAELTLPVQRVLRTVISGVMLVQCFTVYVYLASYIVLLYPVFLEERPTLVLPWLLLAAIRKLLCELTSLSLGLGTCVLLGPARPPCIKFLVVKLVSIMPAFYMWMLVFSYYNVLKVAAAFKTFPPVLPSGDQDYGLELAVRRRRTKSLFGEELLRRKLEASFYNERNSSLIGTEALPRLPLPDSSIVHSTDASIEEMNDNLEALQPMSVTSNRLSDAGTFEDWFGNEVVIPRDADRILEQFVLMLLRISVYLKRESTEPSTCQTTTLRSRTVSIPELECPAMSSDNIDTPSAIRSRNSHRPSYLRDYPELFTRKSLDRPPSERKMGAMKTVQHRRESDADGNVTKQYKRAVSVNSNEKISLEIERIVNRKKQSTEKNNRKKEKPKQTLKMNEPESKDTELFSASETKDNLTVDNKINHAELSINKENNDLINNKATNEDIITEEKENVIPSNKVDEHSNDIQKN